MTRRHRGYDAVIVAGLLALAALVRYWIAPMAERLPADYVAETHYAAESRWRTAPDADWEPITLVSRRVDQALTAPGENIVVQGDMHWTTDAGKVLFEATGLYGVDRRTRKNVPGYGDVARTGQFLFPPHATQSTYTYWDPMFIGPRTATFDYVETLDGLRVYVYRFSGTNMDETAGYSYLPSVPHPYQVKTDATGTLWIEPTSGLLVDYAEQGASYFVEPASGQRVASFYEWTDRYTPETRSAQLRLAAATRLRMLALEDGLPIALSLVGVTWLAVGYRLWNRSRIMVRNRAHAVAAAEQK